VAVATATAASRQRASLAPRAIVARAAAIEDAPLLVAGLGIASGIVAGMFLESGILVQVSTMASFVAGILFPPLGLVVLAFMGPLRSPLAIPAPGFNLILVVAILIGCIYRLPLQRTRLRASSALLMLLAFVLYAFVQQVPELLGGYAGTRAHDVGFLFFQLLIGCGTVLAAGFVLRDRSPYPYFIALLLSAAVAAILGIVTRDGLPSGQLVNLMPPGDLGSRATGPFGNPNNYGQFLAYGATLAAGWFVVSRSIPLRAWLLLIIGILVAAMSLSLSRGAMATLLAGIVALAFSRNRAIGFATVGAALALVIVGYPLLVEMRLTTEAGSASSAAAAILASSDEGRFGAILAGPALFATSPLFGIGFGQYKNMSGLVTDQGAGLVAHNWYGTVLAEMGLLGIVLWLALLVAVARWLQVRPASPRSIGFAMYGAAIVGSMFLEPPTAFQVSVVPAFVLTATLVGDWTERRPSPAPVERRRRIKWSGHPVEAAGRPTGP
jgi:O-antigen ligase